MPAVIKNNTPVKTTGEQETLRDHIIKTKEIMLDKKPARSISKSEKTMQLIDNCNVEVPSSVEVLTGDPLKVAEYGLEPATSEALQKNFMPFFQKAEYWKKRADQIKVTSDEQTGEMKIAREMRLAIRQVRIDADKLRGKLKEDGIRYGKAVQGVYNVIEYLLKPTEEYLYEQERYVEIQKEKKIKENQEARYADIQPYLNYLPISFHNRLGELSVIEWSQVFKQAKGVHDAEVEAKELADKMEREAEEKRLREAEEKRIKDEKEKKELQAKIKAQELENRKAEARAVAERAMREAEEKKATAELKAKEQELEKATAERKAKEQELAKATALAETEKRKRMEAEKMLKETSQRVSSPTIQRQVSAVETGPFPQLSIIVFKEDSVNCCGLCIRDSHISIFV